MALCSMGESLAPRRSIRGKLYRMVLRSVGVALGIAALLSLWQETGRYIISKRETLIATAQIFGAASSKAVAARDAGTVLEAIRAVGRVPGLSHAAVEDAKGETLAQIGAAVRLAGDFELDETRAGSWFDLLTSQTVQVAVPVIEAGQTVGRIVIVSDTSDLFERFQSVLLTAITGSVLAALIGLLISSRLQRSITQPLVSLTRTMATIERSHDYDARIAVTGDDETGALASSFNSMIGEIRRATDEITAREEEMIFRLSRAAEQRDDQTGQHIMRMAHLCRLVAKGLGVEENRTQAIYRAAPMHDVGKIGVPDTILFKAGRLEPNERREMEKHAEFGYEILRDSQSELIQLAAEIALSHHERWDGSGYPRALKGDAIPLSGRIAAVADVCDALASERPYKRAWKLSEVWTYLVEQSGTHFDPACVHGLLGRWADVERLYAQAENAPTATAAQAA
jgi:putative two-component system response regulator